MGRESKLFRVNLAEELRMLRKHAEMSTRSVAAELGTSAAWVSRTETGARQPTQDEVASMCRLYGASDVLLRLLVEKAAASDGGGIELPTLDTYTDQLANVMLLENEAHRVTEYELALVPGLLQTTQYARQILSTVDRAPAELERRLSTRLGRQTLLSRPNGPELWFLIDEFALLRPIGGDAVMREQLLNIVKQAQWPNVRVRIVPSFRGAYPGLDGPFAVYEFAALNTYVYLEDRRGGTFLTDSPDVRQYVAVRDELWTGALDEEQSLDLLRQAAEGLSDDGIGVAQEQSKRIRDQVRRGGVAA